MNFSGRVFDMKPQNSVDSPEPRAQRVPTTSTGLELYSVVALLVLLSACGTAGNILVLLVFRKRRDRLVSTVLIIVLACVDLSTCVIIMPYTVFMEIAGFLIQSDTVCKIYQFLITSNIPYSALIMVTIAADRYLCVCHPLVRSASTRKAKTAVVGLGLCAAGIGGCVSLMYGVYHRPSVQCRTTAGESTTDALDANDIMTAMSYTTRNRNETPPRGRGRPPCASCPDLACLKTTPTNNATSAAAAAAGVPLAGGNWNSDPAAAGVGADTVFDGVCAPNDLILSEDFQWHFQKVYNGLYLVCLVTVVALYVLIYRSVMLRRKRRLREKRKSQTIVASLARQQKNGGGSVAMHDMTPGGEPATRQEALYAPMVSRAADVSRDHMSSAGTGSRLGRRKSWPFDANWMANMKTAVMLFVVTIVFIVTFLPAFMMTLKVIPYNAFVFYLYFANNVANPFIYSFMNQNFRDELRRIARFRVPAPSTPF